MNKLMFALLIVIAVVLVQLPFKYPVIQECRAEGHSWYYCIMVAG